MCYNERMKILAPAGNTLSLKSAIYNGADEVYLGVNEFNARNNIDGFTVETLKSAVDFAHLFGVKINLAVNILFSDDELQSALDLVVDAFNMGVDYFIIQDLGLISLIKKHYPQIVVHASTQMGLHNLEGVEYVQKFGIRRVVLARETPLEEVKRIDDNSDVEIEYFAQGALCVSFSGNCYLSSYLFNASGNRGVCKQLCRLPYTLKKNGKKVKTGFLLSAKDFNMTERLSDLKRAGVDVVKIEGRARRPFYVGTATKHYQMAISGQRCDNKELMLAFNRDFTEGYLNGNSNVISPFNNHVGIYIGKVIKVNKGKTFNEIFFNSSQDVSPKSTLKIFDGQKEKTTLSAFDVKVVGDGVYRLTTTHDVGVGNIIRLIADAKKEALEEGVVPKRKVGISIFACEKQPIKATICVNGKQIEVQGQTLEIAKKSPLSESDFIDCFNKSEYFIPTINFESLGNIFMAKSQLNEFRRTVYETVFSELTKLDFKPIAKIKIDKKLPFKKLENYQIIENGSEILCKKNIIYSPQEYVLNDISVFVKRAKEQGKNAYLDLPNFALEKDIALIKDIIEQTGVGIVANNYYALGLTDDVIIGGGLNVYNSHTANVLNAPILVAEGNLANKVDFAYMTFRHCPLKEHAGSTCDKCNYCDGYEYVTENGKSMKLKRKKLSTCTFYLTD